ncbi:TPA: Arc family DNA binding domain-containing protein [Enterobacter roggenkampii]|nr:Arc family DNA binding domain-containing protein [Enterobacter roggenkampii]
MEKAKEMYQRKVRFPDDVRKAIERNGEEECRQFNTELIYQLRKVYGLTGGKNAQA